MSTGTWTSVTSLMVSNNSSILGSRPIMPAKDCSVFSRRRKWVSSVMSTNENTIQRDSLDSPFSFTINAESCKSSLVSSFFLPHILPTQLPSLNTVSVIHKVSFVLCQNSLIALPLTSSLLWYSQSFKKALFTYVSLPCRSVMAMALTEDSIIRSFIQRESRIFLRSIA